MPPVRSRRILILELSATGHHPSYVRLLLDSELPKFADIILASQKEMQSQPAIGTCPTPFQYHQIELHPDLERQPDTSNVAALIRMNWDVGKLYRRAYSELSRHAPIDFVIVPYLDDCLLNLAATREAFGGTPWLSLTMRTMIHYRHMGVVAPEQSFAPLRRFLLNRILRQRSATSVLTIDPTLAEFARQQSKPYFRKIQYVPDPVNYYGSLLPKSEARRRLDIPIDARVVLLYGEITPRKGALLLVDAVASPECSGQVHVILAGRNRMSEILLRSNAFQNLLAQQRIHILDGFIDDEDEQLILAATDCLWVGYTDFYGVSGVMALAGRHSVPVLASNYGLVGHFTQKHELGVVIEPRNPTSIVAALNRLVADPDFFLRAGRNAVPVFEPNDPMAFQEVVADVVERSWSQ